MHLCRGNCLSQVLPGTLLSPQTLNIQLPSPVVGAGGAVIMFAAPTSSGKGRRLSRGRRPRFGVWGQWRPGRWTSHSSCFLGGTFGKGILGRRDRSWF